MCTVTYTLSLHDALPIYQRRRTEAQHAGHGQAAAARGAGVQRSIQLVLKVSFDQRIDRLQRRDFLAAGITVDRKSTRLNSSHQIISYAVFCLKKKNTNYQ